MADYAALAGQAGLALFDPKRQNIQTQTGMNINAAEAARQALAQLGQTGVEQINQSYEGLLGDMGRNREAAMGIINQQTQNVGQGYQDLAANNLAVRNEGRDYLSSLMGALGFGGDVNAEIQAGPEALAAKLNERNARFGQDMSTMLGNWGAQHNVLYGDQMVNARGAQAQGITNFQSQIANELADAERQRVQREIELNMALNELLGEQSQFELGFAGQLMNRDTDIQKTNAQLAADAARHASSLALEREKMAAAQRGPSDWEKEKFYASLGLDRDKLNSANAQWAAEFGQQPPPNYSGLAGAKEWAAANGLPPEFVSTVNARLAPILNNPEVIDPYGAAIQSYNPPGQGAMPGFVRDSLPSGWNKSQPSRDQFAEIAAILLGQHR